MQIWPNLLNNLLHRETPFVRSEECQSCFEQLKEALCKPLILQWPDPAKPYMLFCHASNFTCAGVPSQTQDNPKDIGPIAYTSDSFSPVQQCWCATEKECYAIYQSILKFDFYL